MKAWVAAMAVGVSGQPLMAAETPFQKAVAAVDTRMALIDAMDNVIPGRMIVAVEAGREPVINVHGLTRAEGGVPVTFDTPFYIASMTKAFVGLMAVRLDATGVMPLEATVASVFPQMKVPGVDLGALTMRRLLSHLVGFRASPLNIRTAYTDLVPVDDYAAIVSAAAQPIDQDFRYDNLGYLLYAAALEKKTGRSWRSWIDDAVFDPLGMQHSSARVSDLHQVSDLHERYDDGWRIYPPKSDSIMHAAGGLVVSAADMARWLRANVGGRSPVPAEQFATAHSPQVAVSVDDGPIRCTGYAFGWRRCELMGEAFLAHGGSYTGMRGQMIILPQRGVGFATVFNSDSMTGGLSDQLAQTFIMTMLGREDQLPAPEAFAARYAQRAADYRSRRSAEAARLRANAKWAGWQWKPAPSGLLEYAGTYHHPAMGRLNIAVRGDRLVGDLNGTGLSLEAAKPDLFGAVLATDGELVELTFPRTGAGSVGEAVFADFRFRRLAR